MSVGNYRVNSPRMVHETIDGEAIIIDLETGTYYSTNGSGAVIWEGIREGKSVDEILTGLSSLYESDDQIMRSAVLDFLKQLEQASLILPETKDETGTCEVVEASSDGPVQQPTDFRAPQLQRYTDIQDLLLVDPIHEVGDGGWPHPEQGPRTTGETE